jgi:energy-coupling factor transporter transmembrane protein EcfT
MDPLILFLIIILSVLGILLLGALFNGNSKTSVLFLFIMLILVGGFYAYKYYNERNIMVIIDDYTTYEDNENASNKVDINNLVVNKNITNKNTTNNIATNNIATNNSKNIFEEFTNTVTNNTF